MYQIQGRNKIGDFESIILDEKDMNLAVVYAKKYFREILSIKNVNLKEEKLNEN